MKNNIKYFLTELDRFGKSELKRIIELRTKADNFTNNPIAWNVVDKKAIELYSDALNRTLEFINFTKKTFDEIDFEEEEVIEDKPKKEVKEEPKEKPKEKTFDDLSEKELIVIRNSIVLFLKNKNKRNLRAFNAKKLNICGQFGLKRHPDTIPFKLEDFQKEWDLPVKPKDSKKISSKKEVIIQGKGVTIIDAS